MVAAQNARGIEDADSPGYARRIYFSYRIRLRGGIDCCFSGEDDMTVKSVILAVAVAVLSASSALAQGWHEYISRDEFFLVGMPSVPQITSTTYRAASGAMLPAKQFVATEGQRRYTVTVVHYMNASAAEGA